MVSQSLSSSLVKRALGCDDLCERQIAALGLAYKPDVDDLRESPAVEVAHRLAQAGAQVSAYEPFKLDAQINGLKLAPTLQMPFALCSCTALTRFAYRADQSRTRSRSLPLHRLAQSSMPTGDWPRTTWEAAGFQVWTIGVGVKSESNV
jgi:UDP-N-acetyl-D-mannosaminuronic acid dehydrogenase